MLIMLMALLNGKYINITIVLIKDNYSRIIISIVIINLCNCMDYSGDGKAVGVLIANKTDLDDRRRRVSPKVGHELATQLGLVYFECSAKDFQGMFLSFQMNNI